MKHYKSYIAIANESCRGCMQRNRCISATSFSGGLRRYFLKMRGFKEKETEAMRKGKEIHEEYYKGIKTLAEYGFANMRRDLFAGKIVNLRECLICNSNLGLRGFVDKMSFNIKEDCINIVIHELKSHYTKQYLKQLAIYGWIFSNKATMIGYEVNPFAKSVHGKTKSKRKKFIMKPFYPNKPYNVNISLNMEFYGKHPPMHIRWMEYNTLSEFAVGISMYIQRHLIKMRELCKPGLYFLNKICECSPCPKWCGYHKFCDRISYDEHKYSQMYMGKSKLLVKNKPKMVIA